MGQSNPSSCDRLSINPGISPLSKQTLDMKILYSMILAGFIGVIAAQDFQCYECDSDDDPWCNNIEDVKNMNRTTACASNVCLYVAKANLTNGESFMTGHIRRRCGSSDATI